MIGTLIAERADLFGDTSEKPSTPHLAGPYAAAATARADASSHGRELEDLGPLLDSHHRDRPRAVVRFSRRKNGPQLRGVCRRASIAARFPIAGVLTNHRGGRTSTRQLAAAIAARSS